MFLLFKVLLLFLTTNISALVIEPDSRLNSDFHINKCCPYGKVVGKRKTCVSYNGTLSFSTIKVYDEEMEETGKSLEDVFSFNVNQFEDEFFKFRVYDVLLYGYNQYLIETGVLQLELPNAYKRWSQIEPSNYCVDYLIMGDPQNITPRFWAILELGDFVREITLTFVSLLSCLVLLLVLVVYSLLPELRNLAGLILMAHVSSLFMSFLLFIIIQLHFHTSENCIILTMSTYFFYLASFCWLSVLSFDIWWTFRGYAKDSPMYRRQQYFKFLMYCLFAFGVPFLMTAGLYTLNTVNDDMKHLPWFVTPHVPELGCYLDGGVEQLYLHIPMLILIIGNCVFYLMTASKIWRLSRGTAVLDVAAAGNTQAHRTHKQRLEVYLKLAVVMGLSWLLELVISLTYKSRIWWLSDTNNFLVSLAIFLIFVCKKEILKKLCKRCMGLKTMRGCPPAKINANSKSYPNQESTTYQLKVLSRPQGGFEYS